MRIHPPAELADFPVVIELPVQWSDQDAFGHANNAVYFRWFESARIAYLDHVKLGDRMSHDGVGPILAHIECNYRKQVKYPDTIRVGARVIRIGRSSIGIEHKLWSKEHGGIAADGKSTIVVFDYDANKPRAVPDWLREAIEKLEGRKIEG